MKTWASRLFVTVGVAILIISFLHPGAALAQGCVAAHSPQPIVSGLSPNGQQRIADRIHGRLTVTIGYRFYNSYKHYIGTDYQEQRAEAHNAVVNHVNLFDVNVNYQLTPRWSLIADVPTMTASRAKQSDPLNNVYRSGGIGDVTVGAQAWVWRPPTESHGNVAFSCGAEIAHRHQRRPGREEVV